ncbi:hypothetical protein [Methanobrevibacter sp.]|uniref:hypothetical protein n=1 Tax=Methanobrevibacter sp. TaxID=66852 RepID=UPI00388CF813
MSIASNVILENTRLGTTRTKIRNKLTEYGIWWDNSLTIFELAERLMMLFGVPILNIVKSNLITPGGFEYSVTLEDAGVPVDWWIDGVHSVVKTNSNGISAVTVPYVEGGSGTVVCKVGRKVAIDINYTCAPFESFEDYAWDYNTSAYDIVKYPSDISHTFNMAEVDYSEVYNLTKEVIAASVVMAIPNVFNNGIGGTNGIHISVGLYQKKDSNQGWGDAIALVNSKSLSNYRDTKILELGAYPGKRGLKYSTSDHVIQDVNVTTGQLTLDSQMYYFDLYYDNGYVKATIRHGNTTDFTHEADISDKITFDTFYPAIMIYDAGGHIQFESISIEPWTQEEENNGG